MKSAKSRQIVPKRRRVANRSVIGLRLATDQLRRSPSPSSATTTATVEPATATVEAFTASEAFTATPGAFTTSEASTATPGTFTASPEAAAPTRVNAMETVTCFVAEMVSVVTAEATPAVREVEEAVASPIPVTERSIEVVIVTVIRVAVVSDRICVVCATRGDRHRGYRTND
jgi:hypothetical protein